MIQYYEWLPLAENVKGVEGIENELAIFRFSEIKTHYLKKSSDYIAKMRRPHKFDFFVIMNHIAGGIKFKVDMEEYEVRSGGNIITCAPGQIISLESITNDFDAYILILSQRFIDSLLVFMNGSIPFRFDMRRQIVIKCNEREKKMQDMFVQAVRYVISNEDNPFRLQMVQHVMMAIFYASDKPREISDGGKMSRTNADVLSKRFLELVKENFRTERQLKFYADHLFITPRYLSRIVKDCTGSSAADWIERYVVLEARALLKSTNMTIQQVSDELNFPSQTFFGKYFKRRVGMSPKQYRRLG
jgi:AraC-like DNA-binding protein